MIKSKDPQEPPRSADPSRHKDKGRIGQLDRKRQKKKTRNKSNRNASDLSWHGQKRKKPQGTSNKEER